MQKVNKGIGSISRSSPVPVDIARETFYEESAKMTSRILIFLLVSPFIFGVLLVVPPYFGWNMRVVVVHIFDFVDVEFEPATPTLVGTRVPDALSQQTLVPTIAATPSSMTQTPTPLPVATRHPPDFPTSISVLTPQSLHTPISSRFSLKLVAPANFNVVTGARPNLQWDMVTLPAGCKFKVRLYHQETNQEAFHNTTTYSWVPHDSVMPAKKYGMWDWQVYVVDERGDVVAESEIWSFSYKP